MSDHLYHQALSANRKLLEENARLKAEVQTLRHQAVHDVSQLGEQSAEIASLKAEVERLTALVESNLNCSKVMMGKSDAVLHERDRLQAENEELHKDYEALADEHTKLIDRNARLKAEVEELTFNPSHYIDDSGEWVAPANFYRVRDRLIDQQNENARLKAEVERLRKANDSLAGVIDQLNAAKNYKPSV